MRCLAVVNRQCHHRFYHATGYGGVEYRVDILLGLVQVVVEVDALGFAAVQRNGIGQSTLVQIVQC